MNNYEGKRLFGSWYIPDFKKPIGVGSFGTVYELRSYDVHNSVTAVKIISIPRNEADFAAKLNMGASEDDVKAMFERTKENLIQEIEMMLKVSGFTNCVGCMTYAVEPHEDCFGWDILIQMEMLESLNEYYKRKGSVTNLDIVRLGIHICSALEACEANKIIHRDIKPANIMVKDVNGKVFYKLGDFGVARTLSESGTMTMSGTLDYMAPELLRGQGDLRVDIYSLGLVMYKLLNANRLPFMPDYPTEISKGDEDKARQKRLSGGKMPEPLYTIGTKLAKVVLKACEFDAEHRYSSPAEMRKDLEKALAEEKEWPVFSVSEVGKYLPSERKAIVRICGNHETVKSDGKEHTVEGYTTNVSNGNIKVELRPGVTASAKGTKSGKYCMGLTKDSFIITSIDANLSIEDVIVEDGYIEIEKAQSRKNIWILGACALAAVAIICMVWFGGRKEMPADAPVTPAGSTEEQVSELAETVAPDEEEESRQDGVQVYLSLSPSETAGFSEVKHDTPIIIERLKNFTDESNITVSEETGEISATIPLENLGTSNDLDSVIRGTINRPLELYFIKSQPYSYSFDDEEGLVDRSNVVSAEKLTVKDAEKLYDFPTEFKDRYGDPYTLDPQQPCIKLKLTDAGMAQMHALDDQEGELTFGFDVTMDSALSYPIAHMIEGEENAFILCASGWKEDSIAEAQVRELTRPTLNMGYYFSWQLSQEAYWENIEEIERPGQHQCNYESITGDTLLLNFETYTSADQISEDQYRSAIMEFRRRLDIIGVPYAIGHGIQNPADIVVYTSPEPYNAILLNILCETGLDFKVEASAIDTWGLEADTVEVVEDAENGTYALHVNFTSSESLRAVTADLFKYGDDRHIYIGDYNNFHASAPVGQILMDGQLDFNALPMAQQDSVDEAHKYILELMKQIHDAGYPQLRYSLKNYSLSEEASFGLSLLPEEDLAVPALIEEQFPGTTVRIKESDRPTLYINLNVETKSGFLKNAFDLTEQIYKKFDFDNRSFDSVFFIIIEETEDTRCRLVFNSPYSWDDSTYKPCIGLCGGDWLNTYTEDFVSEAKSRGFFKLHNFTLMDFE